MVEMEELVTYAKQYGFIFPGSEIYNGFANAWDYGPLGTNLKENIRNAWKKAFIEETPVAELKHYAEDEGKSKEAIDSIKTPKKELKFLAHGVLIAK